MIPLLAKTTIVRRRFAPPVIVGGRPSRGTPTEAEVVVSMQAVPKDVAERLPSGISVGQVVHGVSYDISALRTGDSDTEADRLVIGPRVYQVHEVEHSPAFLGQRAHIVWTAIELQDLSTPDGVIPEDEGDE